MLGLVSTIFTWLGIGGAVVHEKVKETCVDAKLEAAKESRIAAAEYTRVGSIEEKIANINKATELGLIYDEKFQISITLTILEFAARRDEDISSSDINEFNGTVFFNGDQFPSPLLDKENIDIVRRFFDYHDFRIMAYVAKNSDESMYIEGLTCRILNILGYYYDKIVMEKLSHTSEFRLMAKCIYDPYDRSGPFSPRPGYLELFDKYYIFYINYRQSDLDKFLPLEKADKLREAKAVGLYYDSDVLEKITYGIANRHPYDARNLFTETLFGQPQKHLFYSREEEIINQNFKNVCKVLEVVLALEDPIYLKRFMCKLLNCLGYYYDEQYMQNWLDTKEFCHAECSKYRMDEKTNNPKCLRPNSKEILERNADMLAEELPPDTWNRNYQKGSEQV
jgi:hypothetical protein